VVVAGDEEVDLADAVRQLAARGLSRLLCEGGPQLLTALLQGRAGGRAVPDAQPAAGRWHPGLLTAPLDAPLPLRLEHLVDAATGCCSPATPSSAEVSAPAHLGDQQHQRLRDADQLVDRTRSSGACACRTSPGP
jgi:hypothetical protein